MNIAEALPARVTALLRSTLNSEFATVTGKGVPIDTPMIFFPDDDFSAFNVATGLAYPAKAERARRNPKVGLLAEGGAEDPVVAICGMAAVHDSDIQANTDLYLTETGFMRVGLEPWPNAKKAVWYWSRVIIAIAPAHVLWWDTPAAMGKPPQRWSAPAGTVFPASDPSPDANPTPAPERPMLDWREMAQTPLSMNLAGHLTLCTADGFPIPIQAKEIRMTADGFAMKLPAGVPWARAGKATLSYYGRETFVGDVSAQGDITTLTVERMLPINPLVGDPREVWEPKPEVHKSLMARLQKELARRGQSIPNIPDEEPFPASICGKIRQSRLDAPMQGLPPME